MRLLARLLRIFLIAVLLVSMGGHLALLQTIAWGNMVLTFAGEGSFPEAVAKTFDGEHPCELCRLVKESKREEEKKPIAFAAKKQDVVLSFQLVAPVPRSTEWVAEPVPYERWAPQGSGDELLRPPRVV